MAGKGLQSGDPLLGAAGHRPKWFDPALPAREDCVLRDLLDSRARRYPDRICARFEDGSTLEFELASRSENPPTRSGALRVEPDFAEAPTGPYLAMPPARTSSETIGGYWLVAREGQARYRGLEWQAIGESLRAQLLVRTEELTDVEETRTVVGGRTL